MTMAVKTGRNMIAKTEEVKEVKTALVCCHQVTCLACPTKEL